MKLEYQMTIREDDGFEVTFSGQSVNFLKSTITIRPRHIKLVAEIQNYMKEYMRVGRANYDETPSQKD